MSEPHKVEQRRQDKEANKNKRRMDSTIGAASVGGDGEGGLEGGSSLEEKRFAVGSPPNSRPLIKGYQQQHFPHRRLPTDTCRTPIVISDWLCTFQEMPLRVQMQALSELVEHCGPSHVKYLESVITPHFQKDFLALLPRELALKIAGYLSPEDLCRAAQISRHWRQLTEDAGLWLEMWRRCSIRDLFPPSLRRQENWEMCALRSQRTTATSTTATTTPTEAQSFASALIFGFMDRQSEFTPRHQWPGHMALAMSGADALPTSIPPTISKAPIPSTTPTPLPNCYVRARRKAVYLRNRRIVSNWCRRRFNAACQLRAHEDHVITSLKLQGDLIVTGSDDSTVRIWSVTTAECLHVLVGHNGGVWTLQLSQNGQLVISGSTDRSVRVWSTVTGELLHTLLGHASTVRCMALREKVLVTGSRDSTLRIWDLDRGGECSRVLHGHLAAVRCVQYDGRRILSGGYDCNIIVWDAVSGERIHLLEGHNNRVYSLLFESERDLLISGSLDAQIRVWNVQSGQCLQTLVGHASLTSAMHLRGNILISANADATIKAWDITNGLCLHTLTGPSRHASAVTSLQFLENGLVVSSGDDGYVKLWNVETGGFIC